MRVQEETLHVPGKTWKIDMFQRPPSYTKHYEHLWYLPPPPYQAPEQAPEQASEQAPEQAPELAQQETGKEQEQKEETEETEEDEAPVLKKRKQ